MKLTKCESCHAPKMYDLAGQVIFFVCENDQGYLKPPGCAGDTISFCCARAKNWMNYPESWYDDILYNIVRDERMFCQICIKHPLPLAGGSGAGAVAARARARKASSARRAEQSAAVAVSRKRSSTTGTDVSLVQATKCEWDTLAGEVGA